MDKTRQRQMNGYELSRMWFDFCFSNPEKIKPSHTALYFFCIEHCNRLGWKDKFGLPTTMAKEAIGIHSYNTYINTLKDLVVWGFIIMVQKSVNQYSSNIIALSKNNIPSDKALDKALIKHDTKQSESTGQSIDTVVKQETKNLLNKELIFCSHFHLTLLKTEYEKLIIDYPKKSVDDLIENIKSYSKKYLSKYHGFNLIIRNWIKRGVPEDKKHVASAKEHEEQTF